MEILKLFCFFYWPTSTVFLIVICFSSSLINTKNKFWVVPHLLHMCVIFFVWPLIFGAHKNHIAVHLLQLMVLVVQKVPYLIQLLLEAFPISGIKKCLIYRKSTFSHLFYLKFFSEKTVIHCDLVPNTLEIQSRTRLTFLQSQHLWLHNVNAHKHSVKHNPFDL